LVGEDGGLDGCSVGNSLVRVDGLVQLTTTKVLGNQRLNLRDTGRSTDEDNVLNLGSRHLRVLENLVDRVDCGLESDSVDLLETSASDVCREIGSLEERIDLHSGLSNGGKSTLGTLTSGSQATESTRVLGDIELVLALEFGLEVLEKSVVEIFSTEMGVSSSGLDSEYTTSDRKKGDIERSTSQIEDEDVLLLLGLLIETVGDGSGSGLIDDTEDLKTGNRTGILGSKTLRVIEVGRDARVSEVRPITYVTTAFLTVLPSLASEMSFIFVRTMAEIS
jgi:hypothetical protein